MTQRENTLDSLAEGAACLNQAFQEPQTLDKDGVLLRLVQHLFLKANGPDDIPEPVVIRQNNEFNIFPLIQQSLREEYHVTMDKFWGLVRKVHAGNDASKEIWRPRFQGYQLKCLGIARYPQTATEWDRLEVVVAGIGPALIPRVKPADLVRQIRLFIKAFGNLWRLERRHKYKRHREPDVNPANAGFLEERQLEDEFQCNLRSHLVQTNDKQLDRVEQAHSHSGEQTSQMERTLDKSKLIATLIVGGKEFTTTMATLHCVDGSFFSKLVECSDGASEFFVDRSPLMFGFILDYLRAARYQEALEEFPLPDSLHELQLLRRESKFYRIPILTFLVEEKIDKKRVPQIQVVVLETPPVSSEEDFQNELVVLSNKANSLMGSNLASSDNFYEIISQDVTILEQEQSKKARLSLTMHACT